MENQDLRFLVTQFKQSRLYMFLSLVQVITCVVLLYHVNSIFHILLDPAEPTEKVLL